MSDQPPIACDPSAIDEEAHDDHRQVSSTVFEHITDLQELPDGYAFRLPTETELVQAAGAFISRERLCCPFFHYTLDVSPDEGPVWLELTGRDGVKQYIEDAVLPYWDLETDLLKDRHAVRPGREPARAPSFTHHASQLNLVQ